LINDPDAKRDQTAYIHSNPEQLNLTHH